MAVFQSTFNRDMTYQLLAKTQPLNQFLGDNRAACTSMGLSTDNSGVLPTSFYGGAQFGSLYADPPTNLKGFHGGEDWPYATRSANDATPGSYSPSPGWFTPGASGSMITSGSLAGPIGITSGDRGVGNCVTVHTNGSASYTYTKAWVADQVANIYQVGLYTNYSQVFFAPTRRLVWVQALSSPIRVAPGDNFTITVTISL